MYFFQVSNVVHCSWSLGNTSDMTTVHCNKRCACWILSVNSTDTRHRPALQLSMCILWKLNLASILTKYCGWIWSSNSWWCSTPWFETMLLSILVSERSIGLVTLLFLVSTDGIIAFMKKLSGPSSRGQNLHFHISPFNCSCSHVHSSYCRIQYCGSYEEVPWQRRP